VRLPTLFDKVIAGRTLYGEARGEPREGKVACAWVMLNRVRDPRWPDTWAEVCLQRLQFSCWWERGSNLDATMRASDADVETCMQIAGGVMAGLHPDPTGGANHYLTEAIARSDRRPSWFRWDRVKARHGAHLFVRL
jgi:N-acetylmuramoyl-L-alanine amidase